MTHSFTPAVLVAIDGDRPKVLAFLRWIGTSEVFPVAGLSCSGADWARAAFLADQEPAVRECFDAYEAGA